MGLTKNRLGMSALISHSEKKPIDEQIKIFSDCGFDSFFLSYGVTSEFEKIPYWAKVAKKSGILFEAVHNPTSNVNDVWTGVESYKIYQLNTKRIIDYCAEGEVSKLVLHTGVGNVNVTDVGLKFWSDLEQYAKNLGVKLCYENANSPKTFTAVVKGMDAFHGICHDVGHQFCYTPTVDYQKIYADKIAYTHLHDNLSKGKDMHLLPGDGKMDWTSYFSDLSGSGYKGTLNLELSCYHYPEYQEISFREFAKLSYERISALVVKIP